MAEELALGALDPAAVTAGLDTAVVGREVRSYRQVGSTMDLARAAAQSGAPDGRVIVADEQTAGRGRLNRQWVAPPGSSLLTTTLLRPRPEIAAKLTIIAALAVCEAIEEVTGLTVRLKWPNDALINGKKVCGILIEAESDADGPLVALVGIGLNVNFDPANLTEAVFPPTTLSHELGRDVDRLPLLRALLRRLDALLAAAARGVPVHEQWQRRLDTLGQRVRVTVGADVMEGLAEGVGPNGELLVRRSDGTLTTVVAGDVTLRG